MFRMSPAFSLCPPRCHESPKWHPVSLEGRGGILVIPHTAYSKETGGFQWLGPFFFAVKGLLSFTPEFF